MLDGVNVATCCGTYRAADAAAATAAEGKRACSDGRGIHEPRSGADGVVYANPRSAATGLWMMVGVVVSFRKAL